MPVRRETHRLCKHLRLVAEQCDNFCIKITVRTNALLQICQIAKLGVKFHRPQSRCAYPFQWQSFRQMGHDGKTPVPKAGMMGAIVTEYGSTFHPAFQVQVLRQSSCFNAFSSSVTSNPLCFNKASCWDKSIGCLSYFIRV